jgi:hypothetical protein
MELLDYIVGEGLIMIPVLLALGQIIKDVEVLDNKWIPVLLLLVSIIMTPWLLGGFTVQNIIQAVLLTGAAVYGNQVYKQLSHDNSEEEELND